MVQPGAADDLEAAWNAVHDAAAIGATELDVLREMARCLRAIGEGRVPR